MVWSVYIETSASALQLFSKRDFIWIRLSLCFWIITKPRSWPPRTAMLLNAELDISTIHPSIHHPLYPTGSPNHRHVHLQTWIVYIFDSFGKSGAKRSARLQRSVVKTVMRTFWCLNFLIWAGVHTGRAKSNWKKTWRIEAYSAGDGKWKHLLQRGRTDNSWYEKAMCLWMWKCQLVF